MKVRALFRSRETVSWCYVGRFSSTLAGTPGSPDSKDPVAFASPPFEKDSSQRIDMRRYVDTCIDRRQYVAMRKQIAQLDACCTPLGPAPLSTDEAGRMAEALGVLADPVRLQIVSLLASTAEACVCDLTPAVGVSQPTVSHHLRVLADAGLVDREQRGRWAFYRLRPEPLRLVADALVPRSRSTAA